MTKNLRLHWSYKVNGGYWNGDELAPNWERGKKTSCRCMGVGNVMGLQTRMG